MNCLVKNAIFTKQSPLCSAAYTLHTSNDGDHFHKWHFKSQFCRCKWNSSKCASSDCCLSWAFSLQIANRWDIACCQSIASIPSWVLVPDVDVVSLHIFLMKSDTIDIEQRNRNLPKSDKIRWTQSLAQPIMNPTGPRDARLCMSLRAEAHLLCHSPTGTRWANVVAVKAGFTPAHRLPHWPSWQPGARCPPGELSQRQPLSLSSARPRTANSSPDWNRGWNHSARVLLCRGDHIICSDGQVASAVGRG